ncbi:MAG: hypothetical protein WC350_01315 [Candidatus Micrarchaeia archaeon]|jgi:hypothetical protein
MAKHRTVEATQAAVVGRAPRRRNLPKGNVWRKAMEMLASGKMRSPNHRMEAEKIAEAAKREEKKDRARASRLHERAGDMFRIAEREDPFSCRMAPMRPAITPGFSDPLPDMEDPEVPVVMHREAMEQYKMAARLVRKADPERAKMLDDKAAKECHLIVFGPEHVED